MRMKTLLAATAFAAVASLAAASANAAIINGSFESGFSGWTVNGNAAVAGVDFANDGTQYDPVAGLLFADISGGSANEYQTLSQTFTHSGGTVSGFAAYLARDYVPYEDDSYVRIYDSLTSLVVFSQSVSTVGDYGRTPWTHFSTTLGAGSYTIEAGVRNLYDSANTPNLLLDNVSSGTPEPGTWALMLSGFFGAGAMLRRRRQVAFAA